MHLQLKRLAGAGYDAQQALLDPVQAKDGGAMMDCDPAKPKSVGGVDSSSFERWAQSSLNALGEAHGFLEAPVEVNGSLRGETRSAARAFQKASKKITGKRLAIDGVVGKNTKKALEIGTSSSAPKLREKDRKAAPEPIPSEQGVPAADGGDGGGMAAAPVTAKKPARDAEGPEEKVVAGAGKNDGKAAPKKPGEKRSGDAGKADEIRSRFKDGILVSLSIPPAYDSREEVLGTISSSKDVSSYAYRAYFKKWALAGGSGMTQAAWDAIRGKSKLPAKYASAKSRQQGQIRYKLTKSGHWGRLKKAMYGGSLSALADIMLNNNKHIPRSTAAYAKSQRAVAGEGGVKLGKSMIYNKAAEIGTKTTGTSAAVSELLKANLPADGPAPDQADADKKTSLVRFLTIAAHGWPSGMGGHHNAAAARLKKRQVKGIMSNAAGALAPDIRVRLFACHTARGKGKSQEGEGTIADEFREALHDNGKTEGAVIGHRESGESQTNGSTRFMGAGGKDGHDDWTYKQVFGREYAAEFLEAQGFRTTGKVGRKNVRKVLHAQRSFLGREGWMEDISSLEALKKGARARWEAKYPDTATTQKAFKKLVRNKRKKA